MPDQRWWVYPDQPAAVQTLATALGLSPLVAQVLLNREVTTPAMAQEFLQPESLSLPSPLDEFPDLEASVALLAAAIAAGDKIAICGDYDADGMTSTALLLRALRFLGAEVTYAIPSRMQEGYGINERIVGDFAAEGIRLILTVDNGIAAVAPIAYARELGLAVIITDHHDVPPEVPPANAILNPKLIRAESPYGGVAGVGVAYILAICLAQVLGRTQDLTAPLLELFTLGTIADLAPLTGVNRRWVKRGLALLPKSRIIGVQALIQVAGLSDQAKPLKPEDIGFRLGPRINAVGRISDPQIVIEMLTTDDVGIALERAMQCEQANQSRRELCDRIEAEAIAWCEAQQRDGTIDLLRDRVLLVVQPGWHHGVIGIVASRLVERYGVPVFIATYEDEEQKEIRGSARSIPEFNVFEGLQACSDLMTKFGGHRAAGGFGFPAKHLRQVKARLVNYAHTVLAPEHLKPLVTVDGQAQLADLTLELYQQLDTLHPCGIDNPDPVFWTPQVRIVEQRTMGKEQAHLKLTVAQGNGPQLEAIAWRWGHHCPLPSPVDIAYRLKLNEWQGRRTLQLELLGVRPPTANAANAIDATDITDPDTPPSPPTPAPTPPPYATPPPPTPQNSTLKTPTPQYPNTPPLPHSPTAEFFYSRRPYIAVAHHQGDRRELQIHNSDGQTLVVTLSARQGYLTAPQQPSRPVDLGEAFYFNLVRAAVAAIEQQHQARLIQEKDHLLAEKDRYIAALIQQVALLEEKLSHLSAEQQQQFQDLRQTIQTQTTAIQHQEAHIVHLQAAAPVAPAVPASQLEVQLEAVPKDDKALRAAVRSQMGDALWFCLQPESQEDLCAAHHQAQALKALSKVPKPDYSPAALALGQVVDREVVVPFFTDLDAFLTAQGAEPHLGSLSLGPTVTYHLGQLIPLLANRWQTLRPQALKALTRPDDAALYGEGKAPSPLGEGDRQRLTDFLSQWEHPMGQWFLADPTRAATLLAQLHQGAQLAQGKSSLAGWIYDFMGDRLLGPEGLLRRIFGS